MKKRILLLMVALMTVMGISAQSIVGTWADEPEKDESGQTEQVILNIGQKTFEMNILVDSSDEETGTVIVSVSLPGTYTCKDSQLVVALDTEHADAKIEKMEFTKEIQAVFDEMPEMKTMIDNKMAEMVTGLGKSLKEEYGNSITFDIIEQTDAKLTLKEENDDEPKTFTRQ